MKSPELRVPCDEYLLKYEIFLDCTQPFRVQIYTDATVAIAVTAATQQRGLCLEYKQLPC